MQLILKLISRNKPLPESPLLTTNLLVKGLILIQCFFRLTFAGLERESLKPETLFETRSYYLLDSIGYPKFGCFLAARTTFFWS